MKMVWDETVIGWNRFWMQVSLDEPVLGWKCRGWNCLLFWMKWFWTKVFLMKMFLDESVFGWKCFWMSFFFFFCNLDESVPNRLKRVASNGQSGHQDLGLLRFMACPSTLWELRSGEERHPLSGWGLTLTRNWLLIKLKVRGAQRASSPPILDVTNQTTNVSRCLLPQQGSNTEFDIHCGSAFDTNHRSVPQQGKPFCSPSARCASPMANLASSVFSPELSDVFLPNHFPPFHATHLSPLWPVRRSILVWRACCSLL